jgi:hypothetical protein
MNRCDYLDPALVWTGVKDTGKGAGLSRDRLRQSDPAEELSPAGGFVMCVIPETGAKRRLSGTHSKLF